MANNNDNVEVLDFDDTIQSNETTSPPSIEEEIIIDDEQKKVVKNKNFSEKKDSSKNKNIKSSIVMIIVFILLIGSIVALPYVTEFFENIKTINSTPNVNSAQKENIDNTKEDNFVSNIDVFQSLNNIKDIKSYMYENTIDIYVKDDNNETVSIKNNNVYSFNETKYKIETNKLMADFSYESIDYYEKLDDVYYEYLYDITTKEYTKTEIILDKFNIIYNIFSNMINYIIDDYTIDNEKQIVVDEKNHTNIAIKTSIDMLKNLSFENSKIQNIIDISKLTISDILIDLYYDENKDLYKIEFIIEDKDIYQDSVEGEIESVVSKYSFDGFNKIEDITLPNI